MDCLNRSTAVVSPDSEMAYVIAGHVEPSDVPTLIAEAIPVPKLSVDPVSATNVPLGILVIIRSLAHQRESVDLSRIRLPI